ncbi:hypothetical protein NEUTE2DRAFT_74583 [Neurospora tetrasperma FGSC 2509]|nr:hypothetical protein NEUTE2DRAFT_74583 [Neurospora tetrasperma FGSC 2509]
MPVSTHLPFQLHSFATHTKPKQTATWDGICHDTQQNKQAVVCMYVCAHHTTLHSRVVVGDKRQLHYTALDQPGATGLGPMRTPLCNPPTLVDSNFLTTHGHEKKLVPTSEAWLKTTTLLIFWALSPPLEFLVSRHLRPVYPCPGK